MSPWWFRDFAFGRPLRSHGSQGDADMVLRRRHPTSHIPGNSIGLLWFSIVLHMQTATLGRCCGECPVRVMSRSPDFADLTPVQPLTYYCRYRVCTRRSAETVVAGLGQVAAPLALGSKLCGECNQPSPRAVWRCLPSDRRSGGKKRKPRAVHCRPRLRVNNPLLFSQTSQMVPDRCHWRRIRVFPTMWCLG
jgi:hypothetical protein